MRNTAVWTAMARTQLEILAISWCFNLTRGKQSDKNNKTNTDSSPYFLSTSLR